MTHMPVFKYCVESADPLSWFELTTDPCKENETIAHDAARDYYENHDGWEATYPLTINLNNEDGRDAGTYEVELEWEPSFSAKKIK